MDLGGGVAEITDQSCFAHVTCALTCKCVPLQDWQLDGNIVGTIKGAGPLSFVKVYESGHMVPMDSPAAALDMITSFTHGGDNSSSTEAAGHPALQMKLEKVRSSHLVVQ